MTAHAAFDKVHWHRQVYDSSDLYFALINNNKCKRTATFSENNKVKREFVWILKLSKPASAYYGLVCLHQIHRT